MSASLKPTTPAPTTPAPTTPAPTTPAPTTPVQSGAPSEREPSKASGPAALSGRVTPTLMERSTPGRRALSLPVAGVPERGVEALLPAWARRASPAALPELSELEVVRHFTELSKKNFSIDENFYPLGSCTMKYNPRVNELAAALPGFADIHPYQAIAQVQGALRVWWELERMLLALTGLAAVSMQPAAGAHGELAGLLCIRAYHEDRGEGETRTEILIPDSAHGTNPASVTLSGMRTVGVKTGADGRVDLDDFRAMVSSRTAGMMITNPSTLGLFETSIKTIASVLHGAGALLYMDGANLNAILGRSRPGDFGVDVMHINMHKTLSTPHGGGGPGSGPIAVVARLEPYLPLPRVRLLDDGTFDLGATSAKSIGRMKAFYGHMGMVWRAYAYLRAHSWSDLRGVAGHAVLNANYVLARLSDHYDLPFPGPCMHEVVFSARRQKKVGVSALDVAKALLDRGFHAPTIYFPLVVPEALMIEPTETEAKSALDAFCDAMIEIAELAESDPASIHAAPTRLPLRRLDEVGAARNPCCAWRVDEAAGAEGS